MDTKKMPKNAENFYCEICDFKCCKQSNFAIHESTRKHINGMKRYKKIQNDTKKCQKNAENIFCDCGKAYKYHSGLWRHKKKCNINLEVSVINSESDVKTLSNLVLEVVKSNNELQKQNHEYQKQLLEVCKNVQSGGGNVNSYNSIQNSNNKTFNLQVFLNETCKDALNLTDFVDSLKLQLSDLENVGKLGYVGGISNIIIKNLKALDVNKRPVHCSDAKRETMYVKDEDKWEKEGEDKQTMKKAIKNIAHKNIQLIPEWKAKYPDCTLSESKKSDQYNRIMIESLSYINNQEDKIIKNVAKEVLIDKNIMY